MRHRCEACDQLVSFEGHNCPASESIIILKRGAKAIGAKLRTMVDAFVTSVQGSAPALIELMKMRESDPERFAKAAELSKTTTKSFKEAWDELPSTKLKELVATMPPELGDVFGACDECGAIQYPHLIAHRIGCKRAAPEDEVVDDQDAFTASEASYAEMCIERERESTTLDECDDTES